jgi:hypothetical protein
MQHWRDNSLKTNALLSLALENYPVIVVCFEARLGAL